MKPTMKLRQVQRGWRQDGPIMIGGPANRSPVYVLQQWWEGIPQDKQHHRSPPVVGEWRDVPVEAEE